MADLPLLIGASLGHFQYNKLIAACQQKNCTKISRSFRHIVQCYPGGSGGFIRLELCWSYRNIGTKRKARQQTANGLVKCKHVYPTTTTTVFCGSYFFPLYGFTLTLEKIFAFCCAAVISFKKLSILDFSI